MATFRAHRYLTVTLSVTLFITVMLIYPVTCQLLSNLIAMIFNSDPKGTFVLLQLLAIFIFIIDWSLLGILGIKICEAHGKEKEGALLVPLFLLVFGIGNCVYPFGMLSFIGGCAIGGFFVVFIYLLVRR